MARDDSSEVASPKYSQHKEFTDKYVTTNTCMFCYLAVSRDEPGVYHQVSSWVTGPKLDGPVLRTRTGALAHEECVKHQVAGQAVNQPEMEF